MDSFKHNDEQYGELPIVFSLSFLQLFISFYLLTLFLRGGVDILIECFKVNPII